MADASTFLANRVSFFRVSLTALLGFAIISLVLVRSADALAPGPWKLMAHGAKTGTAPSLLVEGRWTYTDEYGPASG
jgi:hypothetical protein